MEGYVERWISEGALAVKREVRVAFWGMIEHGQLWAVRALAF